MIEEVVCHIPSGGLEENTCACSPSSEEHVRRDDEVIDGIAIQLSYEDQDDSLRDIAVSGSQENGTSTPNFKRGIYSDEDEKADRAILKEGLQFELPFHKQKYKPPVILLLTDIMFMNWPHSDNVVKVSFPPNWSVRQ